MRILKKKGKSSEILFSWKDVPNELGRRSRNRKRPHWFIQNLMGPLIQS
jgi:hypothetical protein